LVTTTPSKIHGVLAAARSQQRRKAFLLGRGDGGLEQRRGVDAAGKQRAEALRRAAESAIR